ncbi:VQ motif-containing protein 20 [Magnolia sinica]|uniref:VQ motif-containing protein 20 n=1 Tax=Magnolia sinica TaxID=86752 RepID=UPI002658B481|nr:VQ motif-containing protein 20 [Magnolia sinica]
MSPSQINEDQHARREITGQRPTPLKINKDSHLIHKPSSSSSSSSSASSSLSNTATAAKQQRHPVIIYTHSPKIIHTQARDFMALVQKLTGLSHSDEEIPAPAAQGPEVGSAPSEVNNGGRMSGRDDGELSSIVTDEICGVSDVQISSSVAPAFDPPNPFFSEVPFFTPNSSDLFCSSRPIYRYPDSVFSPSNMGSSISPSMMEVLKAFPEY